MYLVLIENLVAFKYIVYEGEQIMMIFRGLWTEFNLYFRINCSQEQKVTKHIYRTQLYNVLLDFTNKIYDQFKNMM